jgi:TetR/AcrR family tetracycline transcriptional repressor
MALDTAEIVDAGLALLREEGLDGVTFRRLTARLGVKAPAIYWRFAGKRELLEAMAEAILRERFAALTPHDGTTAWPDWVATLLHELREALLRYPSGARIITGARPEHAPTLARIAEYALRAAIEAGTAPDEATTRVFTALHFTYGRAIEEQDSAGASDADLTAFAADYPTIAAALHRARERRVTPRDAFAAGLTLILRP